ncbi:MAG: hypothetical protein LBE55_01820 [Clostridiales bacterium]|jgi:hypothetical protein|nr:hypothetical protein [Clostridiales bacterium]
MAGTNVGAVYIDLKLNVKDLQRGIGDIGGYIGGLEGMFEQLQQGITRVFSEEGFAPILQAFEGLAGGINPVKSGLELLQEGFSGVMERVPVLTQDFLENIGAQDLVQDALERLTGRAWDFDESVLKVSDSLKAMPFDYLEESAYGFGGAIDGLDEKSRMFGENWREMLEGAKQDARGANEGFGEIFGIQIPDMWAGMLGGMREGWSGAWTGMKQAFSGIINRIIGGMNNMIGGLNNFRVDLPAWLGGGSFGFNIPKLPTLPALAKGGIVAAPTLALVGERGREAVLPLENNTGWMTDLANVLAEAVAANLAYGRGGESRVNLYLDGRRVAEGIIDDLYEEAAHRDLNPIF